MGKSIRSHLSLHGRAGRVLATLMLAGVLGLALPATAEPACKIEIGSCHREPLSNARGTGVVDRIVVELFRRVGQSACISQLPCERSLLNANSGVSDGDILRVPSVIDERYPNLLVVPELLYPLPMNGFTNRQDVQPHGLAELAPLKVGFVLGWKILEDVRMARGDARLETANSQVDATLAARWERVLAAMGQDAPWLVKIEED